MVKIMLTDKEKVRNFCERHCIQKLAIYGSVLRDDFDQDSDIDVLVDFMPGHVPGFFDCSIWKKSYQLYSAVAR